MSFDFLSLPLEIRRPIYRYAVPHSIEENPLDSKDPSENRGVDDLSPDDFLSPDDVHRVKRIDSCPIRWCEGTCPSILFINRQVHEEACEVLYHENTFPIYVRHPRQPRLPLNESRADDDSFVLISWIHRSWSHPRNGKIPLAILRNHRHLSQICRLHVELPEMRDLWAAEMYMRATTYAAFHGLNACIARIRANAGQLIDEDEERMNYIQQIKAPIDEAAALVQILPRVDQLVIVIRSESYELMFIEYVISSLLNLRGIKKARCCYAQPTARRSREWHSIKLRNRVMASRMSVLEDNLESLRAPNPKLQVTDLSEEAIRMVQVLMAIRERMRLILELRSKLQDSQVDAALPTLTSVMRD